MEPSLHLVPSASNASGSVSIASTANSLGLHDAMRYGTRSLAADVAPKHPLENRLEGWEETQENLQMTLQRSMYGLHAPVRHMMERNIVKQSPLPTSFGGFMRPSNLSLDILMGKDEEINFGDVLTDRVQTAELGDFHTAMEKKMKAL
ncbi:proteasome maturation factor UMP1 [Leucosporidium creatinivorum]|uniref:Proteasome maturation factor UMP1 n=1 Tax=Leucosporidium creatinivorum TaxID=106004 RepID=A0A1Y2EPF6_9BASI|nr:proteasome maturation factor UMP1 [Leucosporidium creatinivorum]